MIKLSETLVYLRGILEESLYDYVEPVSMVHMGAGVPALILDERVRWEVKDMEINVFFEDATCKCSTLVCDAFFVEYSINKRMTYSDYDAKIMMIGTIDYQFKSFFEKKEDNIPDIGQGKILMGVWETLVNCDPECRILVIGSSAPDLVRAGSAYDAIIRALSSLGYYGEIHLYDPYEIEGVFVIENFKVKYFSKLYDYREKYLINGKDPTHIWDDAWVPTMKMDKDWSHFPVNPAPHISKQGPFVVEQKGKELYVRLIGSEEGDGMGDYVLEKGLLFHGEWRESRSEVPRRQKNARIRRGKKYISSTSGEVITVVGAGYIEVNDQRITVYGSGPLDGYDPRWMELSLRKVNLNKKVDVRKHSVKMRPLLDPSMSLVENHPQSRISMKFYGDYCVWKYKAVRIINQVLYSGYERRALFNTPVMLPYNHFGDDCEMCKKISSIMRSVNSYTGVSTGDALVRSIVSVTGYSHVRFQGKKIAHVKEAIIMGARRSLRLDAVKSEYMHYNPLITEEVFDRALRLLVNDHIVGFDTRPITQLMNHYPTRVEVVKKGDIDPTLPVYYNILGNECVQRTVPISIFDGNTGKKIEPRMTFLTYYPKSTNYRPSDLTFVSYDDMVNLIQMTKIKFGSYHVDWAFRSYEHILPDARGVGPSLGLGKIGYDYAAVDKIGDASLSELSSSGYVLEFTYGGCAMWKKGERDVAIKKLNCERSKRR